MSIVDQVCYVDKIEITGVTDNLLCGVWIRYEVLLVWKFGIFHQYQVQLWKIPYEVASTMGP